VNISLDTYKALAKHPMIVAAKEASGNISAIADLAYVCGDDLDIYSGNDDQILPILSLGGSGVISVLSNVLPRETHDICQSYFDGDVKRSYDLQMKYLPLCHKLFSDVNPIPVKEALNLMGKEVGPCRLPLYPMTEEGSAALKAELIRCGLVK
jgi:4-hydroxy-tetrahydrodipicolinate synthase